MQYIVRFNVSKTSEYRQWVLENATAIAENAPQGWTYVGSWFTLQGFGRYDCEVRWELDDYSALGAGWGNKTYQRLLAEWGEYVEDSETYLMKSAADVSMPGDGE